jgi:outer membrane beta-barrel protein
MKLKNKFKRGLRYLIWQFFLSIVILADVQANEESSRAWEEWSKTQFQDVNIPVVQNRQISKVGRCQIIGDFGISNRNDFYNNSIFTFSGRYYFSEVSAWEVVRIYVNHSTPTALNREVIAEAGYTPDVQLSRYQVVTSYVYSPIYGKYAWNDKRTVHFDMYGSVGGGVRFATDLQPIFEVGLGMNNYIFARKLSIVPEYRVRVYSEQRTQSTVVFESLVQLGVAWLL